MQFYTGKNDKITLFLRYYRYEQFQAIDQKDNVLEAIISRIRLTEIFTCFINTVNLLPWYLFESLISIFQESFGIHDEY